MKAYALDLRERVVKFLQAGGSKVEAARRFDLGRRTVYRKRSQECPGCLAQKLTAGNGFSWPGGRRRVWLWPKLRA
jgi:transposase